MPCWLMLGDGDKGGGGIGGNNMYKSSRKELVLALLFDLYLELEIILCKC